MTGVFISGLTLTLTITVDSPSCSINLHNLTCPIALLLANLKT
jgi:hypothetical protein